MKSNKKDYHLQAKRKAFQEANLSTATGEAVKTVVTAPTKPSEVVKKAAAVKVTNKGQNAKISEVKTVSAENTQEPEVIETAAS